MKAKLLVYNLGRIKFEPALAIQQSFAQHHLDGLSGKSSVKGRNVLLFVEHEPVYTTGIRKDRYSSAEEDGLKSLGAQFVRTNRGGLITFHGPGQLVAYPILNLKELKLGMRDYVCHLENIAINICKDYGLYGCRTSNVGVWVNDRKIAAIGVRGSRFVTTHGISINCNIDLKWYDHIVPCGIEDKGVTSLTVESGKTVTTHDVIPKFVTQFANEFGYKDHWEFSEFVKSS